MKLLKVPEAAEILAISKHFTRKLIRDGKLGVVRIGRAVRIRSSDIEQIVNEGSLKK